MSQIGVVQYNSTSPHKLNILQQSITTNNNNKSSDRQVIILRKPPSILPQPKDYSRDDILLTNTARKGTKKPSNKETKTNPPPISVARRNARERNRVKQVNNGFANLRQRIPNFIAQAFESNNGRGGNKKLSKVETLRMAVEYIRSLEEVLALDGVPCKHENISNISYPSPSSSNTPTSEQNNSKSSGMSYSFAMSPSDEDDDLSTISTPPPQQQYIRINTINNTFEIIPSTIYDNTENLDPMSLDNHSISDAALMDPHNLEFDVGSQDLSYLNINSMETTGSLSPGMYSESSLSPNMEKHLVEDQNRFIQVFNSANRLNPNFSVQIKTEINELPVISVKTENDLPDTQKGLVDVINWWEAQPRTTAGS